MSYIGKIPTVGNFQVCDAISVVNNQAAYTMQVGSVNVSPESANHMLVSLNGILQRPNSSFTVSSSTITFAANLVTGDVINFIQILGSVLDLGVPSDSTVSIAKLTATGTKNSTTFLRGDNTFNAPPLGGITVADNWRLTADLGTDQDAGGITANLEQVDTSPQGTLGTAMSFSSGVFTFPSTGTYFIAYNGMIATNGNDNVSILIYATANNSSYTLVAGSFGGSYDDQVVTAYCNTLLNVTNTSNVKVKFSVSSLNSGSVLRGNTATNETGMVFIRLGDST